VFNTTQDLNWVPPRYGHHDSVISIVTRLWDGRSRVRIPARARYYLFFRSCPDQLWGPPTLLFNGYQGSLLEAKWSGREVDCLPPCSVEVTNEWNCTSTSNLYLFASALSCSVASFNLCVYDLFVLLNVFQEDSLSRLVYTKQSISLDLTLKYCYKCGTINADN
jgi:hypothetical protein